MFIGAPCISGNERGVVQKIKEATTMAGEDDLLFCPLDGGG